MPSRRPLLGMDLASLTHELGSRSRAIAVLKWMYEGTPVSLPNRLPGASRDSLARLADRCSLPRLQIERRQSSPDGTVKLVIAFPEASVETVLIPARDRSTVCVSSQAGCTRHCSFCATAQLGFRRNLEAWEMVAQFWRARAEAPPHAPARNVVFMGMGEPLDNLDAVLEAVKLLTQSPAPQLGATQVTVSTSGVLPGMVRFLAESNASLALSLNASTDAQRTRIMPHTKTWPIRALLDALRADAAVRPRRVHFIEYVLLGGFNDSDDDARRVVELLREVPARVNLIPHNGFERSGFRPPVHDRILAFQKIVSDAGIVCIVRWPRGREIAAACGQLALARAG